MSEGASERARQTVECGAIWDFRIDTSRGVVLVRLNGLTIEVHAPEAVTMMRSSADPEVIDLIALVLGSIAGPR